MKFQTIITEEDLEDWLDSHFEGTYQPKITNMRIEDGQLIVDFFPG